MEDNGGGAAANSEVEDVMIPPVLPPLQSELGDAMDVYMYSPKCTECPLSSGLVWCLVASGLATAAAVGVMQVNDRADDENIPSAEVIVPASILSAFIFCTLGVCCFALFKVSGGFTSSAGLFDPNMEHATPAAVLARLNRIRQQQESGRLIIKAACFHFESKSAQDHKRRTDGENARVVTYEKRREFHPQSVGVIAPDLHAGSFLYALPTRVVLTAGRIAFRDEETREVFREACRSLYRSCEGRDTHTAISFVTEFPDGPGAGHTSMETTCGCCPPCCQTSGFYWMARRAGLGWPLACCLACYPQAQRRVNVWTILSARPDLLGQAGPSPTAPAASVVPSPSEEHRPPDLEIGVFVRPTVLGGVREEKPHAIEFDPSGRNAIEL